MQGVLMLRKGPWLEEEDKLLIAVVPILGERRWDTIARASGLKRSGKSCRLRWLNYLRPNLKRDPICHEEKLIIIQLHEQWGNKWSRIAQRLPGRTDNEIKNYWRTHLRKKEHCEEQGTLEDSTIQRCDANVTKFSYQSKSSTDSFDLEIENSTFGYQTSDWFPGLSYDQCGFGQQYTCNFYTNSSWETENGEASSWDSSDCLWDFD